MIASVPAHDGTSTIGNPRTYVAYVDQTVVPGTGYRYRVSAVNDTCASGYTNTYGVGIRRAPSAPTNVTAALVTGAPRQVLVTWTDVSTNETAFRVQRATNAAFTQNRTTIQFGAGVTSYQTPNLTANRQWYFRVQALNLHSPSAWVNATPFPITTGN